MRGLAPGATLGILGGGQLGRMIAVEARRMGYRVAATDPDPACSARASVDVFVQGAFDDADAARRLAEVADVVTVETEHIPAELLAELEKRVAVRPGARVLATVQDRLRQKEFLAAEGLPQPRFRAVERSEDLPAALAEVGVPAVLKARRGGYDGRGQARIRAAEDAPEAWRAVGGRPSVLEAFVPFRMEVSALLARGLDGDVRFHPLAENVHRRGVLHTTRVPARVPDGVRTEAERIALRIAEGLDHVGMMAVEMFVLADDRVLVNEIAPRVHNSGHYTLGAAATSQFEQHARAVLGLPLGDASLLRPAAMLNLLGEAWAHGEPDWSAVHDVPGARLHLYGKTPTSPGRKMGHVVVLDEDADEALALALGIHARLVPEAADRTAPAATRTGT